MIRSVRIGDAQQLVDIYNFYVLNTVVTFDDVPFEVDAFKEKIESIYKTYPFYVFEENSKILGYAYANKWREKPAYKHTVESTVYLHHEAMGRQIGTKLYTELLNQLKERNHHVVIGGLTLPNEGSVKLHEKFGFKQVAHFKEVGLKFDTWLDVGFWQLTF
jgi:phosphinothricin acetyltransferase